MDDDLSTKTANDTINIGDYSYDYTSLNSSVNYTLPATTIPQITSSNLYSTYGNVTITSGAQGATGSILTSSGMNGTYWGTVTTPPGLHVKDDASFEGDVKIKGKSIVKVLETIESRLAILSDPNPEKLEKFAALKKAYEHYKLMEKLIGED